MSVIQLTKDQELKDINMMIEHWREQTDRDTSNGRLKEAKYSLSSMLDLLIEKNRLLAQ